MSKLTKNIGKEKRKVRWATPSKATRIFFASLVTILVFTLAIWLFSLGVTEFMKLGH